MSQGVLNRSSPQPISSIHFPSRNAMRPSRFPISRREFVGFGLAATAGITAIAARSVQAATADSAISLRPESTILFQGDSITDAGRSRQSTGPNNAAALGDGYAMLVACDLLKDHPSLNLSIYNRGISGNKVPDLQKRWQDDCFALQPSVVSILIGVNDIWHKLNGGYDGTVDDYESGYRALLKETREQLPQSTVVICEPFVLRCGAVNERWFPEFDERRAVARKLAEEFHTYFVPFQSMFDEATKEASPSHWAGDGVHPSLAGHALMAETWRRVTGI
jgi:lysophospholipase L1-like esterase